ncbi:MAG: hypothetical protein A2527_05190 [Candidatus Lambdaproteobacteria bacterium RIFOXYD2_FULL_50_16]|uniref:Lipid A biosynthesis acyltransferase n=1 Tax=Candidatus Lambdaproteobacteria bacterium RIFOXYD2_FULL_50_16 TaxID=1817772 RepID=A0A1F6G8Z0_9PROT|nr:MAG: hypothetical protein A2527_05190 [Candidatus Lambdaproteobacteria bacterium RIFOXYD2_FULL_50_16]
MGLSKTIGEGLARRVEWALFKVCYNTARMVCWEDAARIGRGFGLFLFYTGLRRPVVERNLEIAFPEASHAWRYRTARACYANMGSHLMEFLALSKLRPEDLGQLVDIEGGEELKAALAQGRGVIMAGSHFGHWELLTATMSTFIHPLSAYAGRQANLQVDQAINQLRAKFKALPIGKSETSNREMLQCIKDKGVLGLLGDLNVPHKHLFIDFFGIKAAAGLGLGGFVEKFKQPLFYAWITRESAYRHKAHFRQLDYSLTGDKEADRAAIVQLYFKALQAEIEARPDHYFWFNRRFKTRPSSEDEMGVHLYEPDGLKWLPKIKV